MPLLPGRVACAGVVVRPGGGYDLSIASLAIGDQASSAYVSGAAARAIAVGARLLAVHADPQDLPHALHEAAIGKWQDPILGALAWQGYDPVKAPESDQLRYTKYRAEIARNMLAAFPGLLDSQLEAEQVASDGGWSNFVRNASDRERWAMALRARLLSEGRRKSLRSKDPEVELLRRCTAALPFLFKKPKLTQQIRSLREANSGQPVLASSIDALAQIALAANRLEHWSLQRRARIDPKSTWNAVLIADGH